MPVPKITDGRDVSPRITVGYVALMAMLGVAVFVAPGWSAVTWGAIGLVSAGAMLYGAHEHAPPRRTPWWLLAGALVANGIGDTIYGATVRHAGDAPPAITDAFYLAIFPLVAAGLIHLTRTGAVLPDRSRLTDLMAFTCAAALAAWAFIISPSLGAPKLGGDAMPTLAAYTLGDLLVLVASVRMLIGARRSWAMLLLTAGAFGMLISDVIYDRAELGAGWQPGGPAELGYLLFYACWGGAALHPSMAELTAPVEARFTRLGGGWTVLLGLSLAVPPATLLIEAMAHNVRDGVVIAVTSIVTFTLVITRLIDALRAHRRAVARERGLREACGALVSAADAIQVTLAVRAAFSTLMPPGVEQEVVLRFNDGDFNGDETAPYPPPAEATDRRTRLLRTSALRPDLRAELGDFEHTLVCSLIVDRRAATDPGAGALLVAAPEWALLATRDAVEVLAAQAALALERIALTEAAARRDNDEYLRTVVQNTADVVVITDESQRIRYASPSLVTVLGIEPPVFATLRDIVHPDDHDQVTRTMAMAEQFGEPDGARDIWSLRRPDGSRVQVEVSYRDLRRDRIVRGIVITMRDITKEQAEHRQVIRRTLDASPAGQNRRSVAKKYSH